MSDYARLLAERIMGLTWPELRKQRHSQADLMSEYLRRAAWISQDFGTPWPFYDFADSIDPDIRADSRIVEAVGDSVPSELHFFVSYTCQWALHYKELEDSGVHSSVPPNPFEPLILMYERGNSFSLDATGFIEVDFIGIPKKKREDHLFMDPLAPLDKTELDRLDALETPE